MSKICKWGNSLGLRLPASIAATAGLKAGAEVRFRLLDNGSVLLIPNECVVVSIEQKVPVERSEREATW